MTNAFVRIGNGPEPVLVLHGWFGDHQVFEPMFPALDRDRFSYIFCDYRGYGANIDVVGAYSLSEIAADALMIVDALGFEHFHVVGHSMGGVAAQRLMIEVPSRVKSLVGITPVPASGVPMDADGLALFRGAADDDANRAGIIHYSTGNRLPEAWVKHLVAHSRATATTEAFAAYFETWSGASFAETARGITTPVMVATGAKDLAITDDMMAATYGDLYPDCERHSIVGAGHYPMIETPLSLTLLVEDFLARHS